MQGKKKDEKERGSLVYSTQYGKMCSLCEKPVAECECRKIKAPFVGDGVVRVARETKGRKGKCVTVVTGVPLPLMELIKFGKDLKKKCGSGGTVKDGVIELQGDHRDVLVEEIKKKGWTAKRSGG